MPTEYGAARLPRITGTIMAKMPKPRNPVAKFNNEFNKPKVFRNRKKKAKMEGNFVEHPKHRPYKRCPSNLHNYLLEEDDE